MRMLAHELDADTLIYRTPTAKRPVRVVRNDLIAHGGGRYECRIWVRPMDGGALACVEVPANSMVEVAEFVVAKL